MIRVSSELQQEIRAHGERDYPYECCGAMLGEERDGVKVVQRLRPLTNVHEDGHERRYLVSGQEMYQLERESRAGGLTILGFYHSHPDHPARPSDYDREWAWPCYSYVIVAVAGGKSAEMTCWTLDEDRAAFSAEQIRGE